MHACVCVWVGLYQSYPDKHVELRFASLLQRLKLNLARLADVQVVDGRPASVPAGGGTTQQVQWVARQGVALSAMSRCDFSARIHSAPRALSRGIYQDRYIDEVDVCFVQ